MAKTTGDDLAARFRLIGDPTRMAILDELSRGECCVCDLVDILGVAQPLLSHHLRALRDVGLVKDRKDGRWAYYSVVPKALDELQAALKALAGPKPARRRDCT
jgi:ArsR family transcriptional regulator